MTIVVSAPFLGFVPPTLVLGMRSNLFFPNMALQFVLQSGVELCVREREIRERDTRERGSNLQGRPLIYLFVRMLRSLLSFIVL